MKTAISTILTPENIAAVLEILTKTPEQLEHFSSALTAEQLHEPLADGERSFTENLAHLINVESVSSQAIYLALLLDEPLLQNIHPERDWGQLLQHELFDFADLLAYFKFRRMVLLRVLNSLTESQWARVIQEEDKQRKESVYWRARTIALHELEHLMDLESKLGL